MNTHEKISFVKISVFVQKSRQVVYLKTLDQLVFCNHEISDGFQSKYFQCGKYSKPTKNGALNDYFFGSTSGGLSQHLC